MGKKYIALTNEEISLIQSIGERPLLSEEKSDTKRQTYYLTHRTIKTISLESAKTGVGKSDLVEKALEAYLSDKNFKEADRLIKKNK